MLCERTINVPSVREHQCSLTENIRVFFVLNHITGRKCKKIVCTNVFVVTFQVVLTVNETNLIEVLVVSFIMYEAHCPFIS